MSAAEVGARFLVEHGTSIVVGTVAFAVLSLATRLFGGSSGGGGATGPQSPRALQKGPRPRWEVLRVLNYFVIAVFVGSVTYAIFTWRRGMLSSVMAMAGVGEAGGAVAGEEEEGAGVLSSFFVPMLVLWCCCLAYFFGFFGISFLDQQAITRSPSTFGLAQLNREAQQSLSNSTSEEQNTTTGAHARVHTPMNDTPICAEKDMAARAKAKAKALEADAPAATSTPASAAAPAQSAAAATTGAGAGELSQEDVEAMTDEQVLDLVSQGVIKDHQLEKKLGDYERAVCVRRQLYEARIGRSMSALPYQGFDYERVFGANCEIVVGYVPLPCGIVGPMLLDGEPVYAPMATTEGCLVASTNRGCKAITQSGGAFSAVLKDGITRAPCVRLPSAMRAAAVKLWLEEPRNFEMVEAAFNSTTNYGRLQSISSTVAGRNVFLRFCCMTGDAMGMNMVSKGCLKAMEVLEEEFPDMQLVAISGNMCTDKKPAAINWIEGRGKSVVVEAVVPKKIVQGTLKTTVRDMIETNKQKNLIGSAMAASVGGFNAHASNIVTAVFLATGQDPAQNVESSNCITLMDYAEDNESLHVSCTMPSIEVGTVGGGTSLPGQRACLDMLGVAGASRAPLSPGDNARKLARVVAGTVLAGELSLVAALAANHLVRSHMQHNRKRTSSIAK